MLLVNKLKQLTDPKIWNRGKDYFYSGMVRDLDNNGNDWSARVEGSYNYRVKLKVENDKVADWDCTCPYDYGPVCKHVAAAALAIEEQLELGEPEVIGSTIQKKEPEDPIPIKIKDIPAKDLKSFCEEYARENSGFTASLTAFLSNIAPPVKKKINYALKIRKAADHASDRHGFIDYYHAPKAFNEVFDFLFKAEKLVKKNGFEEVFEIAKAVFEEVSEMCQYMDDSDGMVSTALDQSQDLIYAILNSGDSTAELKNKIFEWLMSEYPKEKYQGFLGDEMLLDMLVYSAKILNTIPQVLPLLEQALLNAESDYTREDLLIQQIDLLNNSGQHTEAESLLNKSLRFSEIRRIKLDQLLQQQKYDDAEKLIKDGIKIAREDRYIGTEIECNKALLDIYNKTGNKKQQLIITRWLFKNDSNSRTEHLKKLKIFFTPEQWLVEREKLIVDFKKSNNWYLFDFYTYEEMWGELFSLLKKNPHFHLLRQYDKYLIDDYQDEMLEMYDMALNSKAEMANNRKDYKELTRDLKSVKKLKGGSALVKKLVSQFRETYKRRPAMMEELSVFN